jgi:hypothetical protein
MDAFAKAIRRSAALRRALEGAKLTPISTPFLDALSAKEGVRE